MGHGKALVDFERKGIIVVRSLSLSLSRFVKTLKMLATEPFFTTLLGDLLSVMWSVWLAQPTSFWTEGLRAECEEPLPQVLNHRRLARRCVASINRASKELL